MNENASPDKQPNRSTPREHLLSLPPTERAPWLAQQLRYEIATILGVTPDEVSLNAPFGQLNAEWADLWHTFGAVKAPVERLLERHFAWSEFTRRHRDAGPIQSIQQLARHLADEFEIPAPQAPYTDLHASGHWGWGPPAPIYTHSPRNDSAVFVLAAPRTGSTLLRLMLTRHPALFCGPELHLLPFASMAQRAQVLAQLGYGWMNLGLQQTLGALEQLTPEQAEQRLTQLVEEDMPIPDVYRLFQDQLGQRMLVDKSPTYTAHLAWLSRAECLFENPRYVCLVRHPCAAIESFVRMRMHWLTGNHYGVWDENPWLFAEKVWALHGRNTLDFLGEIEPQRQHWLRYEDLVTRPGEVMRAICESLSVPYDDAVVHPYEGISETWELGDVNLLTYRQIDPALATAWTKSPPPQELSPFTREVAAELGYDV
jgi:hypothetical protein